MKISRRRFLGGLTASAAALLPLRPAGLSRPERFLDCVVLDLKAHCVFASRCRDIKRHLPANILSWNPSRTQDFTAE